MHDSIITQDAATWNIFYQHLHVFRVLCENIEGKWLVSATYEVKRQSEANTTLEGAEANNNIGHMFVQEMLHICVTISSKFNLYHTRVGI